MSPFFFRGPDAQPSRFRNKVVQCRLFYIRGSVNQIAVQSACKSLKIIGQLLRTLNANLKLWVMTNNMARRSLSMFFAIFFIFLRRTQMQLSWHSLQNRENFHLFFLFWVLKDESLALTLYMARLGIYNLIKDNDLLIQHMNSYALLR